MTSFLQCSSKKVPNFCNPLQRRYKMPETVTTMATDQWAWEHLNLKIDEWYLDLMDGARDWNRDFEDFGFGDFKDFGFGDFGDFGSIWCTLVLFQSLLLEACEHIVNPVNEKHLMWVRWWSRPSYQVAHYVWFLSFLGLGLSILDIQIIITISNKTMMEVKSATLFCGSYRQTIWQRFKSTKRMESFATKYRLDRREFSTVT